MGFNIGGIAKDLGVNLPKIDFGSIGKTVLDEGKKLLGEVVKDSFTLSANANETFAPDMNLNILGENVRLPNPVGRLANKLLGGADSKLGQFGVNVDFKKLLGSTLHLPTAQGDVPVPAMKDRAKANQLPSAAGANATGGGAVSGANATGGGSASAASSASTSAASSGGVWSQSGGNLDLGSIFGNLGTAEGKMNKDLADISGLDASAPDYQGKLLKLQTEIQNIQRMFDTISQMLKSMHDTKMQIIGNLK